MLPLIYFLIAAAGLFAIIHLVYYIFIYSKFSYHKNLDQSEPNNVPISVIITVKNELKNLKEIIPAVLAQKYSNFEVIIINGGSWDGSKEYLEDLVKKEPKLKHVEISIDEKYNRSKKFAITLGIKAASHEWLLFTNGDCMPLTDQWLSEMSRGMQEDKDIVLGYSRYTRQNNFPNLLSRWDNFTHALRYFSFALNHNAYTGIGRNLAYRKSLFFGVKGFAKHQHILVGEDELFINETANKSNVAVVYSRESFTESTRKMNWSVWAKMNRIKIFIQRLFKGKHWNSIAIQHLSQILFYVFAIMALVLDIKSWPFILGIFLFKLIIQAIILYPALVKLRQTKLFAMFLLTDVLSIPYYLSIGLAGLLTKKIKE